MLTFEESFAANGAPDVVFDLLADAARVVECLPGANLDSAPGAEIKIGDEMTGGFELKIGPIKTRFAAEVRVLEFDREQRRYVLGVRAQDSRGNGEVESTVALAAIAADAGTRVHTRADMEIRGRIATFGTATVERVSQRVLQQFAENLAQAIDGGAVASQAPGSASTPSTSWPAAASTGRPVLAPAGAQIAWPIMTAVSAFACGYLLARLTARDPVSVSARSRRDLMGSGRHRR